MAKCKCGCKKEACNTNEIESRAQGMANAYRVMPSKSIKKVMFETTTKIANDPNNLNQAVAKRALEIMQAYGVKS